MARVDFTNPEVVRAAASFPFYGQATALVRMVDPYWKVDPSYDHEWEVSLSKVCGCNCPHCIESDKKTITVEARTAEQAQEMVESDPHWDEWEIEEVELVGRTCVPVPEWVFGIGAPTESAS